MFDTQTDTSFGNNKNIIFNFKKKIRMQLSYFRFQADLLKRKTSEVLIKAKVYTFNDVTTTASVFHV